MARWSLRRPVVSAAAVVIAAGCLAWAHGPQELAPAEAQARQNQQPLFIDDSHDPTVMISWVQRDGTRVELARTMPWGTKADLVEMGLNVMGFAAVGGTRIDLQDGHPLGSVVRAGFYKKDGEKPFFTDIKPGASVEVRFEGVKFLEDAQPMRMRTLHHLQYALEDVLNCGLDGSAIDQYNTTSRLDTIGGNVSEENGRPGVLRLVEGGPTPDAPTLYRTERHGEDGEEPQPAERFATVRYSYDEATQTWSVHAEIPYELFRHVRDPWRRTEPGTFFEPTHFHLEFESLPVRAIPGGEAPAQRREPEADVAADVVGS